MGVRARGFERISIHSSDLFWSEWGQIHFNKKAGGDYRLPDGTELDMHLTLELNDSTRRIFDKMTKMDKPEAGKFFQPFRRG
jgi:hypothetical protein